MSAGLAEIGRLPPPWARLGGRCRTAAMFLGVLTAAMPPLAPWVLPAGDRGRGFVCSGGGGTRGSQHASTRPGLSSATMESPRALQSPAGGTLIACLSGSGDAPARQAVQAGFALALQGSICVWAWADCFLVHSRLSEIYHCRRYKGHTKAVALDIRYAMAAHSHRADQHDGTAAGECREPTPRL